MAVPGSAGQGNFGRGGGEVVYFLDAREKTQQVLVGDEASFLETPDRPQWDFAQD